MRKATWIAAGILTAWACQAAAAPVYLGKQEPPKPIKDPGKSSSAPAPRPGPGILGAGDTFGTATPIAAIPYADAGYTCDANDDYYPSCAFAGNSAAPDLVYSYTPTKDGCITVSTCGSGYDTILHVYDGDSSNLVACNDDDPEFVCGLDSFLEFVPVSAGHTYYIVVDGYSTACGDYVLEVTECPPPCIVECPPNSTQEGEPDCEDEYVDETNGGCNSTPPVYTQLECHGAQETVCGKYGTYSFQGLSYRDTDWYQIEVTKASHVAYCLTGEAPSIIAIIDGGPGCPITDPQILAFGFGGDCETICIEADLTPGTYWLFAAPDTFTGVPCGSDYVFTLAGNECPVAVEPVNWSTAKGLYR